MLTTVRSGPAGTVWVQRLGAVADVHPMALNTPDPPTGWGGGTWDLLDANGRYLGSVTLPARFRVARIGDERMFGVVTDELGVDRVLRLRIVRPHA